MTAHSELLARLEGASEGSRELDARLFCFEEDGQLVCTKHGEGDQ